MDRSFKTVHCDDLDAAIAEYNVAGYHLDMISPADAPTRALLSKNGEEILLQLQKPSHEQSGEWIVGRAGMEYRDLLPGRLNGRLIASHIRLTTGGEVPDYVHFHKVQFQLIYCVAGAIKVVYEDQGPPFWLVPGDCVLQPPEIRHRVLEAEAGSEVIELGVPAVHETWIEHDIKLPTATLEIDREYGGQRFLRHIAADAAWTDQGSRGCSTCVTANAEATGGFADVVVLRVSEKQTVPMAVSEGYCFLYCLNGEIGVLSVGGTITLTRGSAFVFSENAEIQSVSPTTELLAVSLPII